MILVEEVEIELCPGIVWEYSTGCQKTLPRGHCVQRHTKQSWQTTGSGTLGHTHGCCDPLSMTQCPLDQSCSQNQQAKALPRLLFGAFNLQSVKASVMALIEVWFEGHFTVYFPVIHIPSLQ